MFSTLSVRLASIVVLTGSLILLLQPVLAGAANGERRATAVIAALSTGDAAVYERAAQEHFTPAMLARRTPQERAAFVATVHGDFGALDIIKLQRKAQEVEAIASGRGRQIRFAFTLEPSVEERIQSLRVEPIDDQDAGLPNIAPPPIAPGMSASEMSAALDAWIAPYVRRDDFAGVILVARDAKPLVLKAYGPANRERNVAANEDTAYNVASIGKKFTHTAVAKLLQTGKLKLTTTLGEVLADYPNEAARGATVDQLINMKGGIADFFGPEFEAVDKGSLNSNHAYYQLVSRLPQRFAPGSKTEYCNGCYVVLGEMIERITGAPFEDFIGETVFRPARMGRSGYFNSAALPANTASMYGRVRDPSAPYENTAPFHGLTGSGAGGVYTTAKDLLAFDNALRDGKLLNPEMTAWVLRGPVASGRNLSPMGIAGGSPGASALLESGGRWAVIVTANVNEPLPERLGIAIARKLLQ